MLVAALVRREPHVWGLSCLAEDGEGDVGMFPVGVTQVFTFVFGDIRPLDAPRCSGIASRDGVTGREEVLLLTMGLSGRPIFPLWKGGVLEPARRVSGHVGLQGDSVGVMQEGLSVSSAACRDVGARGGRKVGALETSSLLGDAASTAASNRSGSFP
jgi:hypothetical protein